MNIRVEKFCQPLSIMLTEKPTDWTCSPTVGPSFQVPYGVKNPLWLGFALRFSRLRVMTGLSGNEFATLAGLSLSHGYLLEGGARTPGINSVDRVARALSVSPTWLGYGPEGYLPYRSRRIPGTVDLAYPAPIPHEVLEPEVRRYLECGERMRRVRSEKGLSLRELVQIVNEPAGELRVSYMTVYNTEIGKSIPRLDNLESIAVALDVPPGWLAFGDDPD